jgi:hypothetical protein
VKTLLALAALLALPVPAAAADATATADAGMGASASPSAGGDEAEELARSIAQEAQALSTDDCLSACKALASMRRATDRLCALDPGPRCADARATLDGATRKVRDACPQCALAAVPPERDKEPMPGSVAASEAAPPAEHRSGGCAGCTTSRSGSGGAGAATALAAALAIVLVRRRSGRGRGRERA